MLKASLLIITALFAYLLLWPVPIDPVSWNAPVNQYYVGDFEHNTRLDKIEILELEDTHGPEGLALLNGEIYAATREGWIVRYNEATDSMAKWVNTEGSPLGLAFDAEDNLLIADAYKGLLSVSPAGEISVLTDSYNGVAMEYVDDVDVDAEGKIYFSDASTKFGAQSNGGTYAASLLDTMEHGGHGRLMVYDPADQSTKMLMDGLNFANGVAVAEDSSFVLVTETGSYRLHKYWLKGDRAGTSEVLIDNLPGFPDNIVRGRDGRFWVGLVSPRSQQLDDISASPFLRKIVQRLPASVRPQAVPYSHVFAMDKDGLVITSLQDPNGEHHTNTGAMETDNWLYISSLHSDNLARISRENAGI
ncbi:SMP-30/gluconolactonase/LRE family protein [SAR92 clade bacterium H455]|uniref:SMP-30/gluconolactonase/LRE family protein n=1 Tax=SAR92 clade bacterium H455 TaxID=2974818 RepID=A0ABY5TRC0_9GAMM|nr:SMP-30/gluconolactonase/LRE family protein [SAR92 clade bacterium H455]